MAAVTYNGDTWRYENPGTADLLKVSANTVTDLPATQSKTGTAFWQSQRVSVFPIPATKELWVKFDLYYGGSQWRAYDRLNGNDTGVGRYQKANSLTSFINGPLEYTLNPQNTLTSGVLRTFLLHMVSDATNGLVEVWVDGVKYYSDDFAAEGLIYKGNVEGGADFENFYLQSPDNKNLFSNVIISNAQIGLDENVKELSREEINLSADVQREVVKNENFSADVTREVANSNFIVANVIFSVERKTIKSVNFSADVSRKVGKELSLTVWLPFDNSPTEDLCGNTWTAYGNPAVGATNAISGNALQLTGNNYLQCDSIASQIGNDIWTIHWYAACTDSTTEEYFFGTYNANYGTSGLGTNYWVSICYYHGNPKLVLYGNDVQAGVSLAHGQRYHYALSYDGTNLRFFIDGQLKITKTARVKLGGIFRIGNDPWRSQQFTGSIDEFVILKGEAWAANFTPPTAEDYFYDGVLATVMVDVERTIRNPWRYENAGDADDLILTAPILTDLPATQSKTGTAFYQTTRAKCFDLPATSEVWMKFDVYFNGSQRWRAYNEGNNGTTGVTAQTADNDRIISVFSNNTNVQQTYGFSIPNQLQTVLLHMISGSSDGIIEAWVDGNFIYRYTGDVNHGQDFADIYLQSDGSGTFFSNVIISNVEIGLDEDVKKFSRKEINFSVDAQREVRKRFVFSTDVTRTVTQPNLTEVFFTADVARSVISQADFAVDVERTLFASIFVPFIGDRFNHYIDAITIALERPQKFILPKKSKAYVRGSSEGNFKIFTDTDTTGRALYGDFYAELDECKSFYIATGFRTSPLQIIHALMHSLDETTLEGTAALNEAVNFATDGYFTTNTALINQFMTDLEDSASYEDFLQNKCGIILNNDDTGAITGSDAGGSDVKTAHSVVPEEIPVENWTAPRAGSSVTIRGLTVQFPAHGISGGDFNVTEKHILAGLYSEWIKQSLILIEKSFGLSFNTTTASPKTIYVTFYSTSGNGVLAYVAVSTNTLELFINLAYAGGLYTTSEDGISPSVSIYLDRTLAHEFTHAVMAANINSFSDLPLYFKEGAAELVHGIDDDRRADIRELVSTDTGRSKLRDIFANGGASSSTYPYAAGYMLLRYLAKQGAEHSGILTAAQEISRLLISDSATDSDYNALTDNTRQFLSPDIARTLQVATSFTFDVETISIIPVDFIADVKRALLAEIILFPFDNENFFQQETNHAVRLKTKAKQAPTLKANSPDIRATEGFQSFSVTIAEQQITEQISFTCVIPFDIMQQVRGQYFDYKFNMRVERTRQEGILYSCECCSDIDQLLYTQLDYKLPETVMWREDGFFWQEDSEDDDGDAQEIETYYPPASEHVQKIAAALGLQPVMQFTDFLSTVLMEDNGGRTYNDLIRDVFGWSSRVPTHLINVFIREGKLVVVQRGHEAHVVDISAADKTTPIITRELVRTTWGSTPWSKTETFEAPSQRVVAAGNQTGVREVLTRFSGTDTQGYTTYTYNQQGLLTQAATYIRNEATRQNTYTTVRHSYDDDGTMVLTVTFTQSMGNEGSSASRSIDRKHYVILPNGEKFLASEYTAQYRNDEGLDISDSHLVDSRVTVHSPSRVGQTHTVTVSGDGEIVGEAGGQNTGDDRVTPYAVKNASSLWNSFPAEGDETSETTTQSRTISGLALYDSSFPIHNEAALIELTEALRQLNRKTLETVNLSIYDFPHLIDFNDRVILDGKEYFLSNNTATALSRVFSEQNLTLVRWF